ncbi:MAG: type I methionyl aminopeptidase [Bdellovibrionales bacterium]
MNAEVKSFIIGMEKAGRLAAETLQYVKPYIKPGITTNEIDQLVYDYTLSKGAKPAPLGYKGFPKSVCTSVNDCICHGLPDETVLKDGDTINVDVTSIVEGGFHGDTSATFYVGEVSEADKKLTKVAYEAMHKGILELGPGKRTGDVGFAVGKFVTKQGYFAVREIGGHGIGTVFHTDPFVPSHGKKGKGERFQPWTCVTVEPMVNMNSLPFDEYDIPDSEIKYYLTQDGTPSAQFEHTVLITDTGCEIMTQSGEEVFVP